MTHQATVGHRKSPTGNPVPAPPSTLAAPGPALVSSATASDPTDSPTASGPTDSLADSTTHGRTGRPGDAISTWAGVLLIGALVGAWELGVRITGVPEWLVPAPSAIASALVANFDALAPAAMVTLGEASGGLVMGTAVGLAAAVAITFLPRLERAILSMALLAKSTPIIAVAPILTIWLGFGHTPKVLVTALLTFFPMLVNALEGFRSVDPAIEDWLRSIDTPPRLVFRHARWPTSWPYLFAALKVSAPLAMVGAVVAEWMGASSGLGRSMWLAYTNLRMPELFAAVIVLTLLSALVFQLVIVAEHRSMRWRTSTTR